MGTCILIHVCDMTHATFEETTSMTLYVMQGHTLTHTHLTKRHIKYTHPQPPTRNITRTPTSLHTHHHTHTPTSPHTEHHPPTHSLTHAYSHTYTHSHMQHPNQQNHPHSCQIKKTSTPTKKIAQKNLHTVVG